MIETKEMKLKKLSELTGLDESEIDDMIGKIGWLDAGLQARGIRFKDLAGVQAELPKLSKKDLRTLYRAIGKLLKPLGRATDTEGVKPIPAIVKLTYQPSEKSAESRYHPTAGDILKQSGSASVEVIEGLRARTEKREKAIQQQGPMNLDLQAGILRIMNERQAAREKGARLSFPDFEVTGKNVEAIEGIREILEYRRRQKEGR